MSEKKSFKFYTVYQTTNLINGIIYIGVHATDDLADRYMGSGVHISMALRKYGRSNFKKDILFIFDNEEDMYAKEAELVTHQFIELNTNYNIAPGGRTQGYYKCHLSPSARLLRSVEKNIIIVGKALDTDNERKKMAKMLEKKSPPKKKKVAMTGYERQRKFRQRQKEKKMMAYGEFRKASLPLS